MSQEQKTYGPSAYHLTGRDLLLSHYLQTKETVSGILSNIGKTLKSPVRLLAAAGGISTAAVILHDNQYPIPSHVEAAPLRDGTVGGKGFGISSESTGIMTSWQDGDMERGYSLLRLSASGVTSFPRSGMMSEVSAAYATEPPSDPASCYMLIPLGENNTPLGQSDLLCALRGSLTPTGSPVGFTIRLNQENTASLTWREPGGQDGYFLFPLGGEPIPLPSNTTQFNLDTGGVPKCFVLAAMRSGSLYGLTDILCGLPGFSRFPTIILPNPTLTLPPTLTIVRATETPTIILPSATPTLEPSRTPTITLTRQPTPTLHPYYNRSEAVELLEGRILILGNSSVDQRAFPAARTGILGLPSRTDIRTRLTGLNSSVEIIPIGVSIRELPNFIDIPPQYSSARELIIEKQGRPIIAIGEEHLLGDAPGYPVGYRGYEHAIGHLVEIYGIPVSEQLEFIDDHRRVSSQPGFPDSWLDILYYNPKEKLMLEFEFFAENYRAWRAGLSNQIRNHDEGIYTRFSNIFRTQ